MSSLNIETRLKELTYDAESLQEEFGKEVSVAVKEILEQVGVMQSFSNNCNIAPAIGTARDIEGHLCALNVESDRLLHNSKFVPTSKVFALEDFVKKTKSILQDLEDFTDSNCSCKRT